MFGGRRDATGRTMAEGSNGLVSGARTIGPADLDRRVRQLASGLCALGVTAGDCVALLLRNDIAFIEASFAAQTIGAYALPINWHFHSEEIGYILADRGAKALFVH